MQVYMFFFVGGGVLFALWNGEPRTGKRKYRVYPLLELTSPPMGETTKLGPIHAFRNQYHVQREGEGWTEYGNIQKRRDLDDAVVRWPSAVVTSVTGRRIRIIPYYNMCWSNTIRL